MRTYRQPCFYRGQSRTEKGEEGELVHGYEVDEFGPSDE